MLVSLCKCAILLTASRQFVWTVSIRPFCSDVRCPTRFYAGTCCLCSLCYFGIRHYPSSFTPSRKFCRWHSTPAISTYHWVRPTYFKDTRLQHRPQTWMIHNKLQLNGDKTELAFATSKRFDNHPSLPPMQTCQVNISFSPPVRSLGVVLDQTLSMFVYIEYLRNSIPAAPQNQVHSPLSFCCPATTLICAFVLSSIDYCNCPLAGIQRYLFDILK